MIAEFRRSFLRDLRTIRDAETLSRIKQNIEQIEAASSLSDVSNMTKLQGGGNFYRVRVGDFRMGLILNGETIVFVRCLHRRDIYRYFP